MFNLSILKPIYRLVETNAINSLNHSSKSYHVEQKKSFFGYIWWVPAYVIEYECNKSNFAITKANYTMTDIKEGKALLSAIRLSNTSIMYKGNEIRQVFDTDDFNKELGEFKSLFINLTNGRTNLLGGVIVGKADINCLLALLKRSIDKKDIINIKVTIIE